MTLGLWSVRRFPRGDVIPYVAAQCVGALAASTLTAWILGADTGYGATVPSLPLAKSFVVEFGFTAILGFAIMGAATDKAVHPAVAPFAIGATIVAGALVAGPLTGGSFNPARTLGPAVVGGIWTAHWLYWLAPITGMMCGMRLYETLRDHAPAASSASSAIT